MPTPPPLLPTDTPAVVSISVWENLPPLQAEQLAHDVDRFQKEFSQYAASRHHFETPEDFLSAVRSGQADFDVVLTSPGLLASLVATNQLAPMSDFFAPGFLDRFAGITLRGATDNEKVWGLPETAGFHLLLYYNKALVDTPPATTAQLSEQAARLTHDNQWGLGVNSFDPLWVIPWLAAYDGELTDAANQPTLNTPAMTQALTLFYNWQAGPDAIAPVLTLDQMQTGFLNGDIAMMINGDWAVGELRATQKINWGVAPLPAVGSGDDNRPAAPLVLAKYWAINRQASGDKALAATAFAEFVTRPERQLAWAAKFGTMPTQRAALSDPLITTDAIRRVSAAQLLAGQVLPLRVNANVLLDAMRGPLQTMMAGSLSPQDAAQQMQTNLKNP